KPTWDVDTVAVDGRELRYNPWFVTDLQTEELVGVLAHEAMHCALAHMSRRGTRDLVLWNIACDLAINPLLLDAGIKLPDCRLMPSGPRLDGANCPKGWTAPWRIRSTCPPTGGRCCVSSSFRRRRTITPGCGRTAGSSGTGSTCPACTPKNWATWSSPWTRPA